MKKKTPYIPVFLNLRGRKCIVAGGGTVALRKVGMLLNGGASVKVISPAFCREFGELARKDKIHIVQREYRPEDLKGAFLVVAATDRKRTNRKIAAEAKKGRALVNVVDDPGPSDFIVPSSFRKGDLTVAVSTGGASPALARRIRRTLEDTLGVEYALLVKITGEIRTLLRERGIKIDPEDWQEALDPEKLVPLMKKGEIRKAKTALLKRLTKGSPKT